MQRWGKTAAGKTRYRCINCKKTSIWKRPDNHFDWFPVFLKYILKTNSLSEIGHDYQVSTRNLSRKLEPYWLVWPLPLPQQEAKILIGDGINLNGRVETALIVRSLPSVKSWRFSYRENGKSWLALLETISDEPNYFVCDGQKGLIKAIHTRWDNVQIQRCMIHVIRGVVNKISNNPRTIPGKELHQITMELSRVWTRRQKRCWIKRLHKWHRQNESYLNERSTSTKPSGRKHSWYTHKRLRGAYNLISRALPDLFRYVGHYEVPRTSNHVEGGLNARIKELLHNHRGIPLWKKQILVAYFLRSKQVKKPTRNVY